KPDIVAPVHGDVPATARRAEVPGLEVPSAPAQYAGCSFLRACRVPLLSLRILPIPIRHPFPHVPRQVPDPFRPRPSRNQPPRRRLPYLCFMRVPPPRVRLSLPPGIAPPFQPPRRPLPLRFCCQPHSRPLAVRHRVMPTHIPHRPVRIPNLSVPIRRLT